MGRSDELGIPVKPPLPAAASSSSSFFFFSLKSANARGSRPSLHVLAGPPFVPSVEVIHDHARDGVIREKVWSADDIPCDVLCIVSAGF